LSGSSSVLEDASLLSRLDRQLFRIERVFALVGGIAIFSLMLLAVVSVGGRNFFNQPLPGYVDWIEQAMPLIAFVGVSYCQRLGGHIRMDILVGRLRGRALWLSEFVSTFAMLVLMLLLVWGSWAHFGRSFDFSAPLWSRDSSLDIRLPLWPSKLLVPVAFGVLSLRLALQLWSFGQALITGTLRPVGVPLIEDAATIAAHEAESVSGFDNGAPDR
jgi:TRAP-type C4-dicarboxylate transport system permease small subunit